jgi:sarcosine dehydrogenase
VRDPDGVDADYVMSGDYELEVATERVPAKPFLRPLYDPEMKRVKG